jgi:4-hydroxymandelate oxidase
MNDPVNLLEYEALARACLSGPVFDYFAAGAAAEITLRENRTAFDDLRLRPRVLVPVGSRNHSIELFGQRLASPLVVAPMAFQRLAHPDGEIGAARAAAAAGAVYVASTMATTSLEEIAAEAPGPKWFQLYVFKDRGLTRNLIQRAEAAGYSAIQVTVDVPVLGRREIDVRNRFGLPEGLTVKNMEAAGCGAMPTDGRESGPAVYTRDQLNADLNWKDVEWIRSIATVPVILKGILRGDDAIRAAESGADGIVVSNHGGRQLDTSLATIAALPDVVDAVAGRLPVLLDGGARRGTDVLKAVALGAAAVQVGRPVLWGLAVGGESGVARVLSLLRDEFDNAMALCGCPTVRAIHRDLVASVVK